MEIGLFQSTLPVWGATRANRARNPGNKFQSTLPVWGATPWCWTGCGCWTISIHAPRVGSDLAEAGYFDDAVLFQSTLPVWGATSVDDNPIYPRRFQSTLPVWGATGPAGRHGGRENNFNPRSPCGERRLLGGSWLSQAPFQSTLPVWGATGWQRGQSGACGRFQSTLPVWGATKALRRQSGVSSISIHAPRVGSDLLVSSLEG